MWAVLVGKDAGGLLQPLTEENSWLEFQLKWKGWSDEANPDGTTWEPQSNLHCDKLLARFVQDLRRRRIVPLPGQLPASAFLPAPACFCLHLPAYAVTLPDTAECKASLSCQWDARDSVQPSSLTAAVAWLELQCQLQPCHVNRMSEPSCQAGCA